MVFSSLLFLVRFYQSYLFYITFHLVNTEILCCLCLVCSFTHGENLFM